MNQEFKLPTETVELPSEGAVYPKDHPLAAGKVEMKYMTAKEEDILTNVNYITDGSVLDRVLQSLLVTKFNYDDLIEADKEALIIAARILGYGKDYTFTYRGKSYTADLTKVKNKTFNKELFENGNEVPFTLPGTKMNVTVKLLTHGDQKKIESELKGLLKIHPKGSFDITTKLKYLITSMEGVRDRASIRDFVDNYLMASDSRAIRTFVEQISPGIELKHYPEDVEEGIDIRVGVDFFWPSV